MTTAAVDPLTSLQTVLSNYVSYDSDDSTPFVENAQNNGLIVELFPAGKTKQMIAPYIEVGPLLETKTEPQNIGNTPNSRWLYRYFVKCSVNAQTYQSPNISGYNAITRLCESIRQVIVQNQTVVDGSGDWMLMKVSAGPIDVAQATTVTPDRFERVFVIELWRSVVT